jgi:hypothetical protein
MADDATKVGQGTLRPERDKDRDCARLVDPGIGDGEVAPVTSLEPQDDPVAGPHPPFEETLGQCLAAAVPHPVCERVTATDDERRCVRLGRSPGKEPLNKHGRQALPSPHYGSSGPWSRP